MVRPSFSGNLGQLDSIKKNHFQIFKINLIELKSQYRSRSLCGHLIMIIIFIIKIIIIAIMKFITGNMFQVERSKRMRK